LQENMTASASLDVNWSTFYSHTLQEPSKTSIYLTNWILFITVLNKDSICGLMIYITIFLCPSWWNDMLLLFLVA